MPKITSSPPSSRSSSACRRKPPLSPRRVWRRSCWAMVGLAQASAAKDAANLANTTKAANAAKSGDPLVKLGEDLTGMGKATDAVNAIQAGIKKGVTDANDAQMRLGQAY